MSPIILVHLAAASFALPIAAIMAFRPKGDRLHRKLGKVWVGLMTIVATTSFWITGINGDRWSPIHILSVITLVSLVYAVVAVRKGKIDSHRYAMLGTCVGLIAAFLFALAPGRLLGVL